MTGTFDILWVALDIPGIIKRVKTAYSTKNSEAQVLVLQEILAMPVKAISSILSIIKETATLTNGAALTLLGITTVASALILSVSLVVCSIAYLVLEWTRTVMVLAATGDFENKEKLHRCLRVLKDIELTAENTLPKMQRHLKAHQQAAVKVLGRDRYEQITSHRATAHTVAKTRAEITREKVDSLFRRYVQDPDNRRAQVLSKRIGVNAANAFADGALNITSYDSAIINTFSTRSLADFSSRGIKLLSMVDHQREKVFKLHLFALGVLTFATASIAISISAIPGAGGVIAATIVSAGTSLLSTIKGMGEDAFVKNTGDGFAPRLLVPKFLIPEEGEKTFSILNSLSVPAKIFYVFFSIITLGVLPLFDGAIYKSQWIKRLRGNQDDFDNPDAKHKRAEFTITSPTDYISPSLIFSHPITCLAGYTQKVKETLINCCV